MTVIHACYTENKAKPSVKTCYTEKRPNTSVKTIFRDLFPAQAHVGGKHGSQMLHSVRNIRFVLYICIGERYNIAID